MAVRVQVTVMMVQPSEYRKHIELHALRGWTLSCVSYTSVKLLGLETCSDPKPVLICRSSQLTKANALPVNEEGGAGLNFRGFSVSGSSKPGIFKLPIQCWSSAWSRSFSVVVCGLALPPVHGELGCPGRASLACSEWALRQGGHMAQERSPGRGVSTVQGARLVLHSFFCLFSVNSYGVSTSWEPALG